MEECGMKKYVAITCSPYVVHKVKNLVCLVFKLKSFQNSIIIACNFAKMEKI